MLGTIGDLLNITMVFATALIFASMGGIFSERSGIINIGLEGLMICGAFASAVAVYYTQEAGMYAIAPWIGLLAAFVFGILFSLIHAVASITFKADQVISGIVINILAAGATIYIVRLLFDGAAQTATLAKNAVFSQYAIPFLSKIPLLGEGLFNAYPTTYVALIIVFIAYFVLYKTPFGLRLRAVGEHPGAADTVGINVFKIQYLGVMISGGLAGLGGATLVLTTTQSFTHNTISGQGFIALAAMIFGKWHPFGALGAALFFGLAQSMKDFLQLFAFADQIPQEFIFMLPYILTILILAGFVGKAVGPKALGEAYDPTKR